MQAGIFNVTRAFVTAVSITPGTNAGTISYALTGTNQGATADPGMFLIEVGEQGETLAAGAFGSRIDSGTRRRFAIHATDGGIIRRWCIAHCGNDYLASGYSRHCL